MDLIGDACMRLLGGGAGQLSAVFGPFKPFKPVRLSSSLEEPQGRPPGAAEGLPGAPGYQESQGKQLKTEEKTMKTLENHRKARKSKEIRTA